MARAFNGSSQYFTLADNAALSLPAGNWAVGGWVAPTSVGVTYQDFLGWGTFYSGRPSWSISLNTTTIRADNADGSVNVRLTGTMTTGWQHLLVQRSSDTLYLYRNGSEEDSEESIGFGAINVAGNLCFGCRYGVSSYFGGRMAEWAKWDAALSAPQITALVAGVQPTEIGVKPAWYLPLFGNLHERVAGIAVTNSGSTEAEHPPKIIAANQQILMV